MARLSLSLCNPVTHNEETVNDARHVMRHHPVRIEKRPKRAFDVCIHVEEAALFSHWLVFGFNKVNPEIATSFWQLVRTTKKL